MAEYYYYIPVGSTIFIICLLAMCCRRACAKKEPPRRGQIVIIPNPSAQNTQAGGVWHTNNQSGTEQLPYAYQPAPYTTQNNTQGTEYSDPQQGHGYSSPQGGYATPTSPSYSVVPPPYTAASAPDSITTPPGGPNEKETWGAPPSYNQAVNLDNEPK